MLACKRVDDNHANGREEEKPCMDSETNTHRSFIISFLYMFIYILCIKPSCHIEPTGSGPVRDYHSNIPSIIYLDKMCWCVLNKAPLTLRGILAALVWPEVMITILNFLWVIQPKWGSELKWIGTVSFQVRNVVLKKITIVYPSNPWGRYFYTRKLKICFKKLPQKELKM